MRKFFMAVALVLGTIFTAGCMTTIEPGHTGILISKVGTNRGVSKENLVSGWVFYFPITTKVVEYPVFNQRVAWTHDAHEGHPVNEELTFQTKDNVPVSMDVAVNYTLREDKVPEFYTKFRHFVQSARQRDRLVDAVSRRYDDAKRQVAKKLSRTEAGTPEHDTLSKDLVRVIEKEREQTSAHLEAFETVLKDGLTDVLDPSVSVRDIDKKYRLQFGQSLGEAIHGTGYTALAYGRKTMLIAEFDYSLLGPVTNALNAMIVIKGMTDPVLIIKQMREYADELERAMGGG